MQRTLDPYTKQLCLAAVAFIVLPVHGQPDPEQLTLAGVVRDFKERTHEGGHPDFERRPDSGFAHYAGNIALGLDSDGKPVFVGGGFKVAQQWRDASGNHIAPHMCNSVWDCDADDGGGPEFPAASVVLQDSRGRDGYEVSLSSVEFQDDGTSVWTYHVREIDGGRDLSHWNLKLDADHGVVPGTTPGYDFGLDGSTGFFGIKWDVSDGFEAGDFVIVLDGHYEGATDPAGVLAKGGRRPDTDAMYVPLTTEAAGGGAPVGGCVLVEDPSLGDQPGQQGVSDDGGVDSAASFAQWFRDVPGVNLSAPLAITLVRQDDGTYVFDDLTDPEYDGLGGFFPIDGELFGNPGGAPDHNFHFTFELHTEFTYDADGSQMFGFAGDDDVYVFVDGRLVIDLGGVHGRTEQVAWLDRLGLEDGETYALDFFFAERHRTQSNFQITTNIVLESPRLPTITVAYD